MTVESGGTVIINSATLNLADGFWQGTENFMDGSTLEIQDWDSGSSSGEEGLIDSSNPVSANAAGYYFGNVVINATPNGKSLILVQQTGTQKFCQNDLSVANGATGRDVILTNKNANVEIGGNVLVTQNRFSFGAVTSVNITHTVNGNITVNGADAIIDLGSSSSSSVVVNLKGNLMGVAGTLQCTDAAGSSLDFAGTGIQTIDVVNTVDVDNFDINVTSGTYAQIINQKFEIGDNTQISVKSGGTFDFNFDGSNNALRVSEISGSNSTAFVLESGGTLKITSPDGIDAGTANEGNVRTDTRTFPTTASYGFVGSATPQSPGTGFPATVANLYVHKSINTQLVNLAANVTVSGTLDLHTGLLVTGANKVMMPAASAVTRTNGWVHGFLQKNFATGSSVGHDFQVGDATVYAPINVTFATVSGAGDVTASTTAGDHVSLATSKFLATRTVNRTWTLTNSSTTFTDYSVVPTWVAGDQDAAFAYADAFGGRYDGTSWTYPTPSNRNATDLTLSGITAFGTSGCAFQVGSCRVMLNKSAQVEDHCQQGTGSVTLTASDGTPNYTLTWRSMDGQFFTQIGSAPAQGNSTTPQRYQYLDTPPSPGQSGMWLYYRIKSVGTDGETSYSNIADIYFSNTVEVQVYPNPARDLLYVAASGIPQLERIELFDVAGRRVLGSTLSNIALQSVDISALAPGVYTFKISSSVDQFSGRIIKTE